MRRFQRNLHIKCDLPSLLNDQKAVSAERAQNGAMEKWVPCACAPRPCQNDMRKRKRGPINFPIRLFGIFSLCYNKSGDFPICTTSALGKKKKEPRNWSKVEQVPPLEVDERRNAETLAWVPYPSPLPPPPSASSSSSNWQSEALACKKNNKNRSYCTYTRAPCASKFVISLSNVCTDASEGVGYCAYLGTKPKNSHRAIIVTGR